MQEVYRPPCSKFLGVPTLAGGDLPWPGGGTYLGRGTYLGFDGGGGVPTLAVMGCEQTDACENSTFNHPSDAGGNNRLVPPPF